MEYGSGYLKELLEPKLESNQTNLNHNIWVFLGGFLSIQVASEMTSFRRFGFVLDKKPESTQSTL